MHTRRSAWAKPRAISFWKMRPVKPTCQSRTMPRAAWMAITSWQVSTLAWRARRGMYMALEWSHTCTTSAHRARRARVGKKRMNLSR